MRFLFALLIAINLSAGTLTVSTGGTFTRTTTESFLTAPNGVWAFSFLIDTNPAVVNVVPGAAFEAAFSGVSYTLNAAPVPVTVTDIFFYNSLSGGLFGVCFFSGPRRCDDLFNFYGPPVYSGRESTPTMLTGSFSSTTLVVELGRVSFLEPNTTVTIASVPEPSSLLYLGGGLLILARLCAGGCLSAGVSGRKMSLGCHH